MDRRSFLKGATLGGAAIGAAVTGLRPGESKTKESVDEGQCIQNGPGSIIDRSDDRYSALNGAFNRRFTGNPYEIVYIQKPQDVEEVLEKAYQNDRGVTIRSGGHCYEGWCVNPGLAKDRELQAIIDTSLLTEFYFEERIPALRGCVAVGSGSSNWSLDRMLYPFAGFAPPGGSCYSVAAGGHFSGGGYGLMSRLDGMVVDHIAGIELVVLSEKGIASTILVTENDTGEKGELFWALRGGGGGNFGVVTRFYLRPCQRSNAVKLSSLSFPWESKTESGLDTEKLASLIKAFGAYWEAHNSPLKDDPSNELFSIMKVNTKYSAPPTILCQWSVKNQSKLGPNDMPDSFTKYIIDFCNDYGIRFNSTIQNMGWLEATQTLNGSGPNRRFKNKSAYMKKNFSDSDAKNIARIASEAPPTITSGLIQINSFGGVINSKKSDFNAYSHRNSCLSLQWQCYWDNIADDQANINWINSSYNSIYGENGPIDSEKYEGCYVNYCDSHLPDQSWPQLYYLNNYPRLQAAKSNWDPLNFFRFKQSIRPL